MKEIKEDKKEEEQELESSATSPREGGASLNPKDSSRGPLQEDSKSERYFRGASQMEKGPRAEEPILGRPGEARN